MLIISTEVSHADITGIIKIKVGTEHSITLPCVLFRILYNRPISLCGLLKHVRPPVFSIPYFIKAPMLCDPLLVNNIFQAAQSKFTSIHSHQLIISTVKIPNMCVVSVIIRLCFN